MAAGTAEGARTVDETTERDEAAGAACEEKVGGALKGASLIEQLRKVVYAGVGTVRIVEEEVRDFDVRDFVERAIEAGKAAERDLTEIIERGRKKTKEATSKAEKDLDASIGKVLEKVRIPTKQEVEGLVSRLDDLSGKIDEVRAKAGAPR